MRCNDNDNNNYGNQPYNQETNQHLYIPSATNNNSNALFEPNRPFVLNGQAVPDASNDSYSFFPNDLLMATTTAANVATTGTVGTVGTVGTATNSGAVYQLPQSVAMMPNYTGFDYNPHNIIQSYLLNSTANYTDNNFFDVQLVNTTIEGDTSHQLTGVSNDADGRPQLQSLQLQQLQQSQSQQTQPQQTQPQPQQSQTQQDSNTVMNCLIVPGGVRTHPQMYLKANATLPGHGIMSSVNGAATTASLLENRAINFLNNPNTAALYSKAAPVTVLWLIENYEPAESISLPRCLLYSHYIYHCKRNNIQTANSASFGKLIRSLFPNLRTRRLGTRGKSKYHYYGIKIKSCSELHELGNTEDEVIDALSRLNQMYDNSVANTSVSMDTADDENNPEDENNNKDDSITNNNNFDSRTEIVAGINETTTITELSSSPLDPQNDNLTNHSSNEKLLNKIDESAMAAGNAAFKNKAFYVERDIDSVSKEQIAAYSSQWKGVVKYFFKGDCAVDYVRDSLLRELEHSSFVEFKQILTAYFDSVVSCDLFQLAECIDAMERFYTLLTSCADRDYYLSFVERMVFYLPDYCFPDVSIQLPLHMLNTVRFVVNHTGHLMMQKWKSMMNQRLMECIMVMRQEINTKTSFNHICYSFVAIYSQMMDSKTVFLHEELEWLDWESLVQSAYLNTVGLFDSCSFDENYINRGRAIRENMLLFAQEFLKLLKLRNGEEKKFSFVLSLTGLIDKYVERGDIYFNNCCWLNLLRLISEMITVIGSKNFGVFHLLYLIMSTHITSTQLLLRKNFLINTLRKNAHPLLLVK